MLNTKTEQENVIADIQSKIANMSIQSQQLTRKVNAIKDEITFYEDQTAAIPTKNIKLTEEHDKLKSQLNQLQQTNIDFRQKINSKKAEYEKELDEAKKKKQMLTKQLFPGRRSSSSGLCLSTSESGTSAVEEPFDNIEELFKTTTELPFVLEKIDVLNPSSSGYNDKNAVGFFKHNE